MTNIHAQELGKLGGKKSVKSRFYGKSKKEISEMMSNVRLSKAMKQKLDSLSEGFLKSLNSTPKEDQY
jgi:ABC-type Mn2+/Zn2+ transport system ATPase subunit